MDFTLGSLELLLSLLFDTPKHSTEESLSEDVSASFNMDIELLPNEELADGLNDMALAKQLIVEAGYPDGFKFQVAGDTNDPVVMALMEAIKQELSIINVDAILINQPEL